MGNITTALIAFFSAAIGSGLTLAGVHLTNRNNNKRLKLQLAHESLVRKEKLYRERAEELYELTEDWLNGLTTNYLNLSLVMQGKLTYNQYLDLIIQHGKDYPKDLKRLEMIINMYFPSIKPAYSEVLDDRSALNKISTDHKKSYEQGDIDGSRYLKPYVQAQMALEKKGEAFKEQIVKCATKA